MPTRLFAFAQGSAWRSRCRLLKFERNPSELEAARLLEILTFEEDRDFGVFVSPAHVGISHL